jgi:hypothetical protein
VAVRVTVCGRSAPAVLEQVGVALAEVPVANKAARRDSFAKLNTNHELQEVDQKYNFCSAQQEHRAECNKKMRKKKSKSHPLWADSGEGWGDVSIKCLVLSTRRHCAPVSGAHLSAWRGAPFLLHVCPRVRTLRRSS